MRILKEGDLNRLSTKVSTKEQFECPACGCIFTADHTEYKTQTDYRNGFYIECRCPCCELMVTFYPGRKRYEG